MTSAAFAVPGDITLATGGYAYGRRVLALLPRFDVDVNYVALPGSFPAPTPADLTETRRLLAGVPAETAILADGLAYGAMPAELISSLHSPIVALVHHPLCLEAGLSKARRDELYALEKAALVLARHIIVTSPTTAATLTADFAVPGERITIAEPGTDPAERARGTGRPLMLLAVGSIVPRKAFDVLVHALASVKSRDWQIAIVGPTDRSLQAFTTLQTAIEDTGLGPHIALTGAVGQEQLDRFYDASDLFVMPSLYEGYGMVLAEAMARGLPIVCTTGGAAAATVPDAAAIKVPPGDALALGSAIRRVLDEMLTRHLGRRGQTSIVDLGCGTGSNLRATAPLLGAEQHWTLVDYDPRLLDAAVERLSAWAGRSEHKNNQMVLSKAGKRITVRLRRADLARDLERVFTVKPDLVTASALFDLGSADFISEVAAEVVRCRAAFYTVLTYNGQQRWTPKHDADAAMASAFRAHQTRDKGFGDAAGPMAPALLSAAFDAAGYSVSEGDSAWRLEAGDETLIAALVPGFAGAVRETELVPEPKMADWLKVSRSGALVGHTDTLALPP
jgi:glycosyltransferase involved in cell wall biosynthesis